MILKNLTKNYTTIPNELIVDTSISAGAFRLYCYLASKPETWEVNNKDIMKSLKIGSNNSLNRYWKELIDKGWIEKTREKDEKGKFTGKTILILHNTHNRKSCENGENPLSQKIHFRKNCEIAKSAKHSNTDINSNTEYISKTEKEKPTPKEETSSKREKEPLKTIDSLREKIVSLLKEKNINLDIRKIQLLERKLYELSKSYSLEEIEEVFKFSLEDNFYKGLVVNPNSFYKNFESMKIKYEEEKNKQEEEIWSL